MCVCLHGHQCYLVMDVGIEWEVLSISGLVDYVQHLFLDQALCEKKR